MLAPGIIDERFWFQQQAEYWDLPFYSEMGLVALPDWGDALAGREQLWAIREGLTSM